jgi:hypothetical protein
LAVEIESSVARADHLDATHLGRDLVESSSGTENRVAGVMRRMVVAGLGGVVVEQVVALNWVWVEEVFLRWAEVEVGRYLCFGLPDQ